MRVRASASWVSLSTCQPNQTRLSLPYPLFFFFAAVNVCLTYSPPTVGDGCCVSWGCWCAGEVLSMTKHETQKEERGGGRRKREEVKQKGEERRKT